MSDVKHTSAREIAAELRTLAASSSLRCRLVLPAAAELLERFAQGMSEAIDVMTEARGGLCAYTGGPDGACGETIKRIDAVLDMAEMPRIQSGRRQPTGTVLSIGSIATTDGAVTGVLVKMDVENVRASAALLDERVVIVPVGALSNLHTSASPVRGEAVAVSDNPTPVLCPECGWCGRADELGPEGECGSGDDCSGFPGEITDHADLIHAWQDSEGMVAGRQCADAGLISPMPGSKEAAEEEWGASSLWELTPAGKDALRKAGGNANG